jgi:hypothetical protein
MGRRLMLLAAVVAAAAAIPASARAGVLTLHPSGFGTHSYAAWKAQQGLADSNGGAFQALYFQKETTTTTVAAGVAVIKGIAGLPAEKLAGLSWNHRDDGHCGAGAPRWNVNLQDGSGHSFTAQLGCNAALHTQRTDTDPAGHTWCHDEQPSVGSALSAAAGGEPLANLTVTGLAILFDEGNDTPNPPPAGCTQEQLAGGYVHLDNIEVATTDPAYGTKCWTSASDNSNNSTGPCADPPAGSSLPSTTVLSSLVGLPIDASDLGLVSALSLAAPSVPLSAWSQYPYVY